MIYPWQSKQWTKILAAEKAGRLPHALLIHGPVGIGKLKFAENLAATLLCDAAGDFFCGDCKSCKLVMAESHPDFSKLTDAESQVIKVNKVREIEEKLLLTPKFSKRKIAIIAPAENMNINAANSLLKTLEEPPVGNLIILVASWSHKLLPTIKSRCQHVFMPKPEPQLALSWLQSQNLNNQPELLLKIAIGSPILALQLDADDAVDLYRQFIEDLRSLNTGGADPIRLSKKLENARLDRILSWMILLVTNKVKSATRQRQNINLRIWFELYEELLEAYSILNTSVNKRLLLDNLFLKWQALK